MTKRTMQEHNKTIKVSDRTCLVTGGTGFVGYNLCKKLLRSGWKVFITGRKGEQPSDCFQLGYDFTKIRWFNLGKVDVLFHQAAVTDTTVYDEELMLKVNVWDALKLFEDAFKHGVKQIVYASSCAVYGDVTTPFKEDGPKNPLNIYGKSKWLLDQEAIQWAKTNGVNVVGLRYSNVFGPNEEHKGKTACMVTQIGNQMLRGERPKLFKWGEQLRDFVYVEDVVNYNVMASAYQGQEIFNAGNGNAVSFNEIVDAFNNLLKANIEPEYIENPYQGKYQNYTCCDMTKTISELGIQPVWDIRRAITDCFSAERDEETNSTFSK